MVRARVYTDLEKPKQANDELAAALARQPRSLEALQIAAQAAFKVQDDARAAELASKAVEIYPSHWPSLLLLGRLAPAGRRCRSHPGQPGLMSRALPSLAGEASPLEQCQALLELIELDLQLGQATGVLQRFDALAKTEDLPMSCRLDLARLEPSAGARIPVAGAA